MHWYDPDLTPDSTPSGSYDTWISEFCNVVEHNIFIEVPEDFIDDDFNLTGLSSQVKHYHQALEMILDLEPEQPLQLADQAEVQSSAEMLYGLIHARYIVTRQGMQTMAYLFDRSVFGTCPRALCNNMKLLPTGRYDLPGKERVLFFCPCCLDLYNVGEAFDVIDGAFFGTTFVALFLQTFPSIENEVKELRKKQFTLTVYGFKVSEASDSGPRMKWLRQVPSNDKELEEFEEDELSSNGNDSSSNSSGGGGNEAGSTSTNNNKKPIVAVKTVKS